MPDSDGEDEKDDKQRRFSTESQMAEFQLFMDNFSPETPSQAASTATSMSPNSWIQDSKGHLHPEVGIDRELEHLLAENPGLFMDDQAEELTVHVPKSER